MCVTSLCLYYFFRSCYIAVAGIVRVAKKKKMKEEHKRRQANPFTGEGGPEKRWGWADEVKPGEPARGGQ